GVTRGGEDVMRTLLTDGAALAKLYPADLFDPEMIRSIGLIPTEYLFFYYSQRRAHRNQKSAGASRGEEILRMNKQLETGLAADMQAGKPGEAIEGYKGQLNQRNGSYMVLEGNAECVFAQGAADW